MDTESTCTLPEFAEFVGLSVVSAHRHKGNGTLTADGTLREWTLAYCAKLRSAASGRGGDDAAELTRQRTRLAKADADLREVALAKEYGVLVNVADLESTLAAWVISLRVEVTTAIGRLVAELEQRHAITVDQAYVDEFTVALLDRLSTPPDLGAEAVVIDQVDDD